MRLAYASLLYKNCIVRGGKGGLAPAVFIGDVLPMCVGEQTEKGSEHAGEVPHPLTLGDQDGVLGYMEGTLIENLSIPE